MRSITLAVAVVLMLTLTAYAGARGKKYKEHTIHGMKYDQHTIELLLDDSEVPAEVTADQRGVRKLKGKFKIDRSKPVEEAALDFIDKHRNAFGLKDPKRELKLRDGKPSWHMSFQQYYEDVPVWGHSIGIHLGADDEIIRMQGSLVPTPDIDTTPLVTEEEALEIAKEQFKSSLGQPRLHLKFPVELVIYHDRLAYEVHMMWRSRWYRLFINAKDGSPIGSKEDLTRDLE